MQIFTNNKLISQRARLGNTLVLVGLGSLVVALVTNFLTTSQPANPLYLSISLGAMLIGLTTTLIGSPQVRRFGRSPRPDQIISESIKGFDSRYHFYAWTLPADLVLVGPSGIYAFVVNGVEGKIMGSGDRLQQPFSLTSILGFFGRESLGNPVAEARAQAERLNKYLKEKLPNVDVAVQPVVLFVGKSVMLNVDNPGVQLLTPKMLKGQLRGSGKMVVPERVRKPVAELFDQASGSAAKSKSDSAE